MTRSKRSVVRLEEIEPVPKIPSLKRWRAEKIEMNELKLMGANI